MKRSEFNYVEHHSPIHWFKRHWCRRYCSYRKNYPNGIGCKGNLYKGHRK